MYDKNKVSFSFNEAPSLGVKDTTIDITFNMAYEKFCGQWQFNLACYQGIRGVIEADLIQKHPRESDENWIHRQNQLCSPNYTASIVDAYSAHLCRKQGMIHMGLLQGNPLFNLFLSDCDYSNNSFLDVFRQNSALASVFGAVGYLVDMPAFDVQENMSISQAVKNRVYPYISTFYPPNIMDWQYVRDEWGRPILIFLKLIDDDGLIRCWWDLGDQIVWAIFDADVDLIGSSVGAHSIFSLKSRKIFTSKAKKISEGATNKIKYIPFEVQYNRPTSTRMIGQSDINDIARLDLRITSNLSRIGEIADVAAFPILLLPRERVSNAPAEVAIGPTSILPKGPEAQDTPEWLATESADPIRALWDDIDKTREEIYRTALFGGMDSNQQGSGIALNLKYQMLGSRLAEKNRAIQLAANGILYHWASWMGIEWDKDNLPTISMPSDFKVDDLAADIESAIKATTFVGSDSFTREMKRSIINKSLPNLTEEVQQEIDKEVIVKKQDLPQDLTDKQDDKLGG